MWLNPGTEPLVKLLGLLEALRDFTQLAQYVRGFVVASARTAHHRQIDLVPILVRVIVDLLELTLTCPLRLLTLLALPLGSHGGALLEQGGIGDVLTW